MNILKHIVIVPLIWYLPTIAQDSLQVTTHDSIIIFKPPPKISVIEGEMHGVNNSAGLDIIISTYGLGVGLFYRYEYLDEYAFYMDFAVQESKDEEEKEYVDYWGNVIVPGKVNRFLLFPFFIGAQKRLFKDDVADNFRPFINAALGPTMIYVFPYQGEYFTALGKGRPHYTFGGYIGLGSYIGADRSTLFGINIRYYIVPHLKGGIESMKKSTLIVKKKQFGGFSINLSWGGGW